MKAWQKWAIAGAMWGVISTIFVIFAAMIEFGHHSALSTTSEELVFFILFLPGALSLTILDPILDPGATFISAFIVPPLLGGMAFGGLAYIIEKRRSSD